MAAKWRVVLADSQPIILEALSVRLNETGEFDVVAAVEDSEKAFFQIFERTPDLVITDLELPGRGPIEVARQVLSRLGETRFVFFTSYDTDIFLDLALRLKVSGFLLKTEPVREVIAALRRICRGETVFTESLLDRLDHDPQKECYTVKMQSGLSSLTLRQLQVLRHLARGESVKEVARLLRLSERAVESHKYRIMQKIGIHDRVQLTRYAIREGLMPA